MFYLFIFFFASFPVMAHDGNGLSWGLHYMGGKILIHTPKIYLESPTYSSGLEFSYQKQTTGNKDWQQRFGFPEIGMNLFYSMNGDKRLGNALGIYPSIQFRLYKNKTFYGYIKFGGGIGVISRHWNRFPQMDTMNNIIGSKLNNVTMVQSGIRMTINKKLTAQGALHFYHISNAAARSPNFGINTVGLNLGLNYHPFGVINSFEKRRLKHIKNPLNLSLSGSIAFAEDKTPDGPLFPVYTGAISTQIMYRNKSRIILGGDAIMNTKTRALIKNSFQMNGEKYLAAWQYTAFIGHEFLFGRIGVPLIAGAYLNRPVGGEKIYQKLGMIYHFYQRRDGTFKDAYIHLILKTHLVQAQYAEFGFGFLL